MFLKSPLFLKSSFPGGLPLRGGAGPPDDWTGVAGSSPPGSIGTILASSFGRVDSWREKRSFAQPVNRIRQRVVKNAAGVGVKWVDGSAERFPGWIDSFARRHGDPGSLAVAFDAAAVTFTAPDGAAAACHPPFVESFAAPAGAVG